ncbi:MAG: inositol monophosphatase family protein [Candidatus Thorarchaeota archaeon]
MTDLKKILYELDINLVKVFNANYQEGNASQKTDNHNAAGHKSIVMDLLMEEALIDFFRERNFPCRIESEERGTIEISSNPQYLIITDPLDGSNNFSRKIPLVCYGVAIAKIKENSELVRYKDIIAASVRSLYSNEFFFALKDEIPTRNNLPIEPSKIIELNKAIISLDIDHLPKNQIFSIEKLWEIIKKAKGTRRFGANLLDIVYVGAGMLEAMIDIRGTLSAVHVPGLFISEQAGAKIYSLQNNEFNPELKANKKMSFILTNNQAILEQIIEKIKEK